MNIYCTPFDLTVNSAPLFHLLPPARQRRFLSGAPSPIGPLFAYGLLAAALRRENGPSPSHIIYSPLGKPYFPSGMPHISLSHSKTHALCCISEIPVGVDIETHRSIRPTLPARVLSPTEQDLPFFDAWVLKESYIKLIGKRDRPLQEIAFSPVSGETAYQCSGTFGHLYHQAPGCSAAVCTPSLPPKPPFHWVDIGEILSTPPI